MDFRWVEKIIAKNVGGVTVREAFTQQRAFRAFLRDIKDGEGLLRVTSSHPVEKIAAIGKAFEEVTEHSLIKPFLRHKPKLVLVHPDSELPLIGKVRGMLISQNKIFLDTHTVENLSIRELKAMMAHEMGHHVNLDVHPRNALMSNLKRAVSPHVEMKADAIAIAITEDPQALQSGLKKLEAAHPSVELPTGVFGKATFNATHGAYLGGKERDDFINKIGDKIGDDTQRSHVLDEINRRLTNTHKKTFGRSK